MLLYELLTGQTPFDASVLKSAAMGEIARMLREDEPPKPSNRLSTLAPLPFPLAGGRRGEGQSSVQSSDLATLAKSRSLEPNQLVKQVRGELD